jgi:hypothetical protein
MNPTVLHQVLIRQVKRLYEEMTGWGDSDLWSNQDFLELSEMIFDRTGMALSHVTLKRIWGKVRYESLPHTNTLNTIVQFLGYPNWREFRVSIEKNSDDDPGPLPLPSNLQQDRFLSRCPAGYQSTIHHISS